MKTKIELLILVPLVSASLFIGCSKKKPEPQAAAVDTNAAPPEAAAAAPEVPAAPALTPVQTAEVDSALRQVDQSMKKKDYEAAAKSMLTIQLSNVPLTEQQGYDQVNRMRDLSKMITEGLSSGDPNAQRAAELLRKMQHARTGR